MKTTLTFLLIIIHSFLFAQEDNIYTFGKISQEDLDLKIYSKDSTANAIFLFENGVVKFEDTRKGTIIKEKYYAKIKIFNKEGAKNATIEIPLYHRNSTTERVVNIRAITHNGDKITKLNKENIFTDKTSEKRSVVKFTLPNVQEQSIIEYEYTLESPFKFNFTGWIFQAEIPKIYSRFHAFIPSIYGYNRSLFGLKKLFKNTSTRKKYCFKAIASSEKFDCEELTSIMKDIPAFIEEKYMTSKRNHMSRIKFELAVFNPLYGKSYTYTKEWKDIDKVFKTEQEIGKQLQKIEFVRKKLPKELLDISSPLERAKKIYNFIKNYFTWNERYALFSNVNIKKAFEEKVGNSTEINVALVNALNAVKIHADFVLLSTRSNGLPTKLHPVISDFNYGIVRVQIEGKEYLLDATDKLLPFNMIPFKTLNGYGRVMNFIRGSYWIDIKPNRNNQILSTLSLKINNEGNFEGTIHKLYHGYKALERRKKIKLLTTEKYLEEIEDLNDKINIEDYKNSNLDNVEKPLVEIYKITLENDEEFGDNVVILNPFILDKLKNPFKLKERTYPVDYGYPSISQYTLALKIPETYKVTSLPEKKAFRLPNKGGYYFFSIEDKQNTLKMVSRFGLSKPNFAPIEYPYLKEFYNRVIKTQNSLITLHKK